MTRRLVPIAIIALFLSTTSLAHAVQGKQMICRFKGVMRFQTVDDQRAQMYWITGLGTLRGTCVIMGVKPTVEAATADFNNFVYDGEFAFPGWVVNPQAHAAVSSTESDSCPSGILSIGVTVRTQSITKYLGFTSQVDWPGVNGETPISNGSTDVGEWSQSEGGSCLPIDGQGTVKLAFVATAA